METVVNIRYTARMSLLTAAFLGALQGLTEFLPVSSTGHLVLLRAFLDVVDENALAFDAVLHLATVAAVLVYFRRDVLELFYVVQRKLSRLPVGEKEERLLYALLIGTLPAVALGLLLETYMQTLFRSPFLVAGVLIAGSILFMVAEWRYVTTKRSPTLTLRKGFLIGCFQALALLPGMSRSGATIVGGMFLGLTRSEAARVAFLLAIPVIGGAGAKKLLELLLLDTAVAWDAIAVGAAIAFISGLAAIHFMISFVKKYSLWPFIWYRLILAAAVIAFFSLG